MFAHWSSLHPAPIMVGLKDRQYLPFPGHRGHAAFVKLQVLKGFQALQAVINYFPHCPEETFYIFFSCRRLSGHEPTEGERVGSRKQEYNYEDFAVSVLKVFINSASSLRKSDAQRGIKWTEFTSISSRFSHQPRLHPCYSCSYRRKSTTPDVPSGMQWGFM